LDLGARGDPLEVVTDPDARYFGAKLGERTLVPGHAASRAETSFEVLLSQSLPRDQLSSHDEP
jgi:hypothetical protein